MLCSVGYASVTVTPKFLFLDASRKTIPLYVSNPGSEETEVWLEVKFGYEKSDESGKGIIFIDSVEDKKNSAVDWIRIVPRRFILGPGEMQTIRLVTTPPAGVTDGEYWARIYVTSKHRNLPSTTQQGKPSVRPGISISTQIDLPFHYRVGKVSTGLVVNSFDVGMNDTSISLTTKLARTGNSSFWGKRTIRLINSAGKIVFSKSKNSGVYTDMTYVDVIKNTGFVSGTYTVEIEFNTGQRQDVKSADLVLAPGVITSATLTIP